MLRVGVGLGDGVAVGVGVGDGDGDGVGDGDGEPIAPSGSPIAVGLGDGFGVGIATPLFHTSFFPLLTQVYFLPKYVEVCPAFLQLPPALIAAVAFIGIKTAKITIIAIRDFFIGSVSTQFG